jgi:hypothetical protein
MSDNKDHFYVEQREDGTFAGSRGGAKRASAVGETQGTVVEKLKRMDPSAPIHIERVRNTGKGHPDKWR